jgi:hypothetical protein
MAEILGDDPLIGLAGLGAVPAAEPDIWPPPDPPPKKKASKPGAKTAAQQGTAVAGQQRAADGSARTQAIISRRPAGLSPWTDARIRECKSIPTLEARAAALEEFLVDLGLVCWSVEDEQKMCLKRAKTLLAEARRVKAAKRRPPRKPR